MPTYNNFRDRVRVDLEETTARSLADTDLYGWMDEAAREVSLAARNLRGEWSVTFAAGVATGSVSSVLVMQIDDAWWKYTDSEQRYPLQILNHRDMHSRWGMYRDIRQGIPKFLTSSKTSTSGAMAVAAQTMELRLYPIPQAAGTLYYQGTRAASINTLGASSAPSTDIVECEIGWEYLIVKYVLAKAFARGQNLQKAGMFMAEYQEGLTLLASFADQEHMPNSREYVPSYYGVGDYGYGDDWSW